MIRHKRIVPWAQAPAVAGELTPAAWNRPHLAFDTIAFQLSPADLLVALPTAGTGVYEIGDGTWRSRYDFSQVDFLMLTVQQRAYSTSNAEIRAQWSDDEGLNFYPFNVDGRSPYVWNGNPNNRGGAYAAGNQSSGWVVITPAAKRDVVVRFVGTGVVVGDPVVNYGAIVLWAR